MKFRRPRFIGFTRAMLVLLMITLAGRSDANCSPMAPESVAQSQTIKNCAEMGAELARPKHSSPTHHSDQNQAGMCHLGCPVLLSAALTKNSDAGLFSPTYMREPAALMVGISDIPLTPPPRFG